VHPPGIDALLVDLVDRLLVPIRLGERGASRLPVFEDAVDDQIYPMSQSWDDSRGVGARDHDALDSGLLASRFED
jgi:hypothetical protein